VYTFMCNAQSNLVCVGGAVMCVTLAMSAVIFNMLSTRVYFNKEVY
jgi:hypothetical protein